MAEQETDLVLPLGVNATILNTTTGIVNVFVGPMKKPLSQKEEVPVVLDPDSGRFIQVSLEKAIRKNVVAEKGQYVILQNPAVDGKKPKFGVSSNLDASDIRFGETVNVPGPTSFAPWPGQVAVVVPGHHIKSNEYLLIRVYDEEAAKNAWGSATMKVVEATGSQTPDPAAQDGGEPAKKFKVSDVDPSKLVIGQQLTIKGTEVSFYIPPTGVEVLKDSNGKFVRQALTLERLEYCLLVDEDGNKRYVRGPEVVFPSPTEQFKTNDDNDRKSRAYELNEISGLHVKVIADYKDAYGKEHTEGEELFITGRRSETPHEEATQIYFPRIEHALLKYGGSTRYHAIAITSGDTRYVMNRLTGVIRLEHGPSMFLPDPRIEVIANRILTPDEASNYYPGNRSVVEHNDLLRAKVEIEKNPGLVSGLPGYRTGHVDTSVLSAENALRGAARSSEVIDRGTRYTPPRSITPDPRFDGAVKIRPYTGYAIQVVDQAGNRRVEVGPKTVHLEFDERLEILSLSTGTPKQSNTTLKTVYLRITNNSISDKIEAKTKDLVPVRVHLKYLARFREDARDRWFSVDNYIQNMVDQFRTLINNYARTVNVREFYADAGSLLRDLILGPKVGDASRSGYLFEENGMEVYEINVLNTEILDSAISSSLAALQTDSIKNILDGEKLDSDFALAAKKEMVVRQKIQLTADTELASHQYAVMKQNNEFTYHTQSVSNDGVLQMAAVKNSIDHVARRLEVVQSEVEIATTVRLEEDARQQADLDRRVKELVAEASADKSRIDAISPQLTGALVALAQTGALQLVAKHLGDLSIVRQQSLGGVFDTMFQGTPLEGMLENMKKLGTGSVVGA